MSIASATTVAVAEDVALAALRSRSVDSAAVNSIVDGIRPACDSYWGHYCSCPCVFTAAVAESVATATTAAVAQAVAVAVTATVSVTVALAPWTPLNEIGLWPSLRPLQGLPLRLLLRPL